MHGNMVDIYTPRGGTKQFQAFEKRLRHIPAKRIAPYPNTSSIIAQPKRSRMVFSPLLKGKALSVRPVNVCVETKANLTQGPLHGAVHLVGGMKTRGTGIHYQSGQLQKSLPYDNMRFVSNGRKQSFGLTPAPNAIDKLGCCPLRPSTAGYSTPPYCTKPRSNTDNFTIEAQRIERNPKSKTKIMKVNTSVKNSTVNDLGCLASVKSAAFTTIKVATNCVGDDVSSSNGSVKTTGSSLGYSNNFNPQMTSTPQRTRHAVNSTESSPQFKMPYPPDTTRLTDDLSILLDIVEEERKAGILKMLPLEQLAVMVENSTYAPNSISASPSTYSFDISNNNPYKLPAMAAIGAPKAASSPITCNSSTERCKLTQSQRNQHASNESRPHTTSVAGLWRPW